MFVVAKISKESVELFTLDSVVERGHFHKFILDAVEQMLKSHFEEKQAVHFRSKFERYNVNVRFLIS